jgi:hypothetical protein
MKEHGMEPSWIGETPPLKKVTEPLKVLVTKQMPPVTLFANEYPILEKFRKEYIVAGHKI